MSRRKSVRVGQVLADIGSGATESDLQEKYDISPRGLERLFKGLVAEKHIGKVQLIGRYPKLEPKLVHIRPRRKPRSKLDLALPAYDLGSQKSGLVRDISEAGLRVAGIKCEVGELKTLQIHLDKFMNVDPMLLLARCRWRKTRGRNRPYVTGGFEITALPKDGEVLLRKLVDGLIVNPSLKLPNLLAEEKRRLVSTSDSSDYVARRRLPATSPRRSKDTTGRLPEWIDPEAMKALQDSYRFGTLREILEWWTGRTTGKVWVPGSRPKFSAKRRFVWVQLNEEILRRALNKVTQERHVGYGGLSPVIEQLLWEFIGKPNDVLATEDEDGSK